MSLLKDKYDIGIIVGRFQVAELSEGHKVLIKNVIENHKQVIIVIGVSPTLGTKQNNKYQGKFRKSLLDLSLLEYAIKKDRYIQDIKNKYLIITCLDHIENEHRFTYNGKIINCINEKEFIKNVSTILNIPVAYISKSNNSKNLIKWNSK